MDCRIIGNSLRLPIGTKFSFKYQSLVIKPINIINGNNYINEFRAIFNENDVDFKIWCDNRECDRGIVVTLKINGKYRAFHIPPQVLCILKALENNGRKLHFLSQNTERGRVMVQQTAQQYDISYDLASINCSRIEFSVEVEECVIANDRPLNNSTVIGLSATKIQLFVKTCSGKTITINIGNNNTIGDLLTIIAEKVTFLADKQLLMWAGKILDQSKAGIQLQDYGIFNESTLHLTPILHGGECLADVNDDINGTHSTQTYSDHTESDTTYSSDESSSLQPNIGNDDSDTTNSESEESSDSQENTNDDNSAQLFGEERGVICFGEPSKQVFTDYDKEFRADSRLIVNPFFVEVRLSSRFAQISIE